MINLRTKFHSVFHKITMRGWKMTLICGLICATCSTHTTAQQSRLNVKKNLTYRQQVNPEVLDNYLYSTYYGTGKKTYNLKGFTISQSPMKIQSIKVNPTGTSYAILSSNGKRSVVEIYDAVTANDKIHEFKDIKNPTAIAYSYDSKKLYIAASDRMIYVYDTKTFRFVRAIHSPCVPGKMEASKNGYFLAVSEPHTTAVIDIENGKVRTSISPDSDIRHISFSDDSSMLGILMSSSITIYDTRTFSQKTTIQLTGNPTSFSFHPEGKYISVASSYNTISFVNINDIGDRPFIIEPDGMVSYVKFVRDGKQNIYLSYNSNKSIKYKQLTGFSPNYTKMLRDELLAKMEEWAKIRDDESLDEYKLRVNEESRIIQARLFEQEIATRLADDMVTMSTVTLGGYNPENSMLTLNFDNLPTVYLTVPEKEVQDFMVTENLEFRNAVYGITKDDKFELIYADVYNKATGKQYTFNNLNRQSLDFLSAESEFVPIEIVQLSSMEEVKLNTIKKNVVEMAKKQKLISDHTNIQVNTAVVSDFDAAGNKITNYKIGFNYTVESGYSTHEDFPAGKYKIKESNAAESMLKIVAQAFETDFAQYIQAGKKVKVKITGSADALPINGNIAYDGSYGEFENEPCHIDGMMSSISVTQKSGIKKNEQLAFIRASAVKDYIQRNVKTLNDMNTDYQYNIELSDKRGGKYRRINVEFTFINAF
ncbi:MAG: hypothetical protein IJ328_07345 [Muribaculaceae bacterium]|nr:hypothetical protein [Muribaculaceae bacterium]